MAPGTGASEGTFCRSARQGPHSPQPTAQRGRIGSTAALGKRAATAYCCSSAQTHLFNSL